MTRVDRRHFLMSSMALPVALKASALPSQNDTVRVAVVGFNGRGKAHISAYLKMPNVEIAALCDVDQAVVESGCKMVDAAGKKRPATFSDIRKLLDDKSIDAVSIATPNFHHTLQTIWAVQAGKDVLVEKPVSYNIRRWLPGDAVYENTIAVPRELAPGRYPLRVGMLDPATKRPAIQLAITGRQPDGWYHVGEIVVY